MRALILVTAGLLALTACERDDHYNNVTTVEPAANSDAPAARDVPDHEQPEG